MFIHVHARIRMYKYIENKYVYTIQSISFTFGRTLLQKPLS